MKRKPAKKHSTSRRKSKSQGLFKLFKTLGIPLAIIVILVLAAEYKTHVLGKSTFLAQAPIDGNQPPPEQPPQESQQQAAPQQESKPPEQPQQNQSQPQQQQMQQSQQPQQQPQPGSSGESPQGSSETQRYQYQPKTPEEQKQYQQYQQQTAEQQNQQGSAGLQQGGFPGSRQGEPRSAEKPSDNQTQPESERNQQQSQQNNRQGSPQNQQEQSQQKSYQPSLKQQQQMREQFQQQFQQFQQQLKQEVEKNGIQFSGSLPELFQEQQDESANRGPSGNSGPGAGQNNFGNSGQKPSNGATFLSLPPIDLFPIITGKFEVALANPSGRNTNINLNDANTRIQLGTSGQSLSAIGPNGTSTRLDPSALEKINTAIKLETGSEIIQKGNSISMKRGQVEAQSRFPISFNIATKTFTVETPNGEKTVNVLPDEAVQKLIENKVFSNVQTTASTNAEGKTTQTSQVQLTELNNKPVYEVEGTSQQKLLGFFTVGIQKKTFVSAESGDVVSTDQNVFSRFLDTISF